MLKPNQIATGFFYFQLPSGVESLKNLRVEVTPSEEQTCKQVVYKLSLPSLDLSGAVAAPPATISNERQPAPKKISVAIKTEKAEDPEKALIGKWDGHAETNQNKERTLVITSVKATGSGEWVGSGRFGQTCQDGSDTEINVSSKNNEIFLEWFGAQGKVPVRVKMVGGDKLEGTIEAFDRGRVAPRKITFEKVKTADVK